MIIYVLISIAALLFIYLKTIKPLDYWKIRGVKYIKPVPVLGNFLPNLLRRDTLTGLLDKWYHQFPKERYVGIFQFVTPVLMIRDLELIKDITMKDFDHFTDHQVFSSEEVDPLWSKNLFARFGDSWRDMRTTLSPSFTGSKMRTMFALIEECCVQMTEHLHKKSGEIHTMEMKDMFSRITNDIIATCAFGLGCDSFRETENEFYQRGFEVTDFSGLTAIRFLGFSISPALMKFLGVKIISDGAGKFFEKIIGETIKVRTEQGVIRHDMIHLLMEAQKERDEGKSQKEPITVQDMTAQALIFMIAGFDSTSTLMVYVAYELAVNREVQEKLLKEVDETIKECNGKVTYEALMKMKYLDMVLEEALRKWPPTVVTERQCTKDYIIKPKRPSEKPVLITKGSIVLLPLYSTQRDPEFFANPDKFDPERFSEENKNKIKTGSYAPFGIGPRICIGLRFAMMETKAVILHLLTCFEFVPVKESVIPVVHSVTHYNLTAKGGMWIGLKKRDVNK